MAVWQVEFDIVPRRAVAARLARTGPSADGDWSSTSLPSDYQGKLAAVASPASSDDADLQTWGSAEGNRVDVWSRGGRVERATARVDVRKLDAKFGAMLLHFVRIADAVLVRSDGLVVEPIVGAYSAALRSSSAWKYANDPGPQLASYRELESDEE